MGQGIWISFPASFEVKFLESMKDQWRDGMGKGKKDMQML